MDQYDIIRVHPLFTEYQDRAYQSTFLLEDEGVFDPDQAEGIREQLTAAWDKENSRYVDLLYPQNPREFVVRANLEMTEVNQKNWAHIRAEGIHQHTTRLLNDRLHELPEVQLLTSLLGPIDMSRARVIIYGHDPSDHKYGSDSIHITENGQMTWAVPPSHFGLKLRIMELWSQTFVLGTDFRKTLLGWPLIGGCFELLANENHPSTMAVGWWLTDFAEEQGLDPVELARDFVLGNPQPLFNMLDKAVTPLGTALLIFIDHAEDVTTYTLDKAEVLNRLEELEELSKVS